MELTKDHRSWLLTRLEIAIEREASMGRALADKSITDMFVIDSNHIDHFLAKEEINLIKKSLIENRIDY